VTQVILTDKSYLSETQAFYVLSVLCDRLLPGYYSTTMYGTLLDQKVFESLVDRTLPILSEHLHKSDVQLSVASLPWFLSLYINSMPLNFAFRVLDVFFLEGPKVLFQVGLAILRINGEELLDAGDDGSFISVLKSFFARLGDSAHPKSENPKLRAITNFQALMVVAFKEFSGITQATITDLRAKHKDAVLDNIETFAKRTSIRNLGPESKKLSSNDLGFLYDRYYGTLYERQQRMQIIQEETDRRSKAAKSKATEVVTGVPGNAPEMGRVGLGPSPTLMDYDAFREFLAGLSRWAITDSPSSPPRDQSPEKQGTLFATFRNRSKSLSPWGNGPEPADHDFMQKLYKSWLAQGGDSLTLQDVVAGLARIKGQPDIMRNIAYFFELYDTDKDGKVDREGILSISEGLLFLSRRGMHPGSTNASTETLAQRESIDGTHTRSMSRDEQFLGAISAFIRRCFEYADPGKVSEGNEEGLLDLAEKIEDSRISDNEPNSKHDKDLSFGQTTGNKNASANAALDPENPLHLTLPTFRMLVLADENLEAFFDSGFPNSFHLADAPLRSSIITTAPNLSAFAATQAGLPTHRSDTQQMVSTAGPGAGVVAPGKGIRGMLDNIVTDGMRVAAEVKRRMDEAQKELDRGGVTRGTEEDDDDDEDEGGRDLLEGADAEAGVAADQGQKGEGLGLLDEAIEKEVKIDKGKGREVVSPVESTNEDKETVFER